MVVSRRSTNTLGRYGLIVDLETGRATMLLDRGDYHEDVSHFSIAFFSSDGRTLLVHATGWNRLDISDPATGELLTPRGPTSYIEDEPRPAHYLDYFHCQLTVSPDHQWIVDNGWVWHPYGVMTAWNLWRWFTENVWEAEDGPSLRTLCARGYYWDGPLCWIDATTLAVWGYGEDDKSLLPAVRLFDVSTGVELGWFPGPQVAPKAGTTWPDRGSGWLVYDTMLFSISPEYGTAVWDVTTGERLLHTPQFAPLRYHRRTRQFLSRLEDGRLRLSHLEKSSEYQYYEFLALDKPLSAEAIAEVRKLSSRAQPTPTQVAFNHSYGDFRSEPLELLAKHCVLEDEDSNDPIEPPLPPGLKQLDAPLQALIEFLRSTRIWWARLLPPARR